MTWLFGICEYIAIGAPKAFFGPVNWVDLAGAICEVLSATLVSQPFGK